MSEQLEPQVEQWLYMGVRVNSKGQKVHAWQEPGGKTFHFKGVSGRAIGGAYEVKVTYRPDGAVVVTGDPAFITGNVAPEGQGVQWQADHEVAQIKLAGASRERQAKKQQPLDEALRPLLEVAHSYRTHAQQDALAAYVIRRLHSAWAFGLDEIKGES